LNGALVEMQKAIVQNLTVNAILCLLLFLPAGTFDWPQAWIFLAIFNGAGLAIGTWLRNADPELLAERMKSPFSRGQRPRDRLVMIALGLFFCVWITFIALDARRFDLSHSPIWAQVVGAALVIGAFWGWVGVLRANRYAATTIKLQGGRGQTVISTGPYAIVRHPMYAYAVLLILGTPLLLGSMWGLLGVAFAMPLLAARAFGEEELLMNGLQGYRDYADRVQFRLVPWIW
jgi:protein-S-isoprenylcysteine O-methyltransferase Ste14